MYIVCFKSFSFLLIVLVCYLLTKTFIDDYYDVIITSCLSVVPHVQVSEVEANRQAEELRSKVMRLEASLLRSDQDRDQLKESLFVARSETHKRTHQLRSTIQVSL